MSPRACPGDASTPPRAQHGGQFSSGCAFDIDTTQPIARRDSESERATRAERARARVCSKSAWKIMRATPMAANPTRSPLDWGDESMTQPPRRSMKADASWRKSGVGLKQGTREKRVLRRRHAQRARDLKQRRRARRTTSTTTPLPKGTISRKRGSTSSRRRHLASLERRQTLSMRKRRAAIRRCRSTRQSNTEAGRKWRKMWTASRRGSATHKWSTSSNSASTL